MENIVAHSKILRNLIEVERAPKFWGDRGIDILRFIGMVVRDNDSYLIDNNLLNIQEEYSDALRNAIQAINEYHLDISISNPRFREWFPIKCPDAIYSRDQNYDGKKYISVHHKYEFNENSPIGNSCSSPFTTARIDWDRNVYLCHNQLIGNLETTSFKDIWSSYKADSLRNKLIKTQYLCSSCDYFNLCINSHYLDTKAPENYFSNDFKQQHPHKYNEIIRMKEI